MKILNADILNDLRQTGLKKLLPDKPRIGVGMGTCGIGNGAADVFKAFQDALAQQGVDAVLVPVGCFGFCAAEPLVNIHLPGQPLVIFQKVTAADVPALVAGMVQENLPLAKALCKLEEWDHLTGKLTYGKGLPSVPLWHDIPFYKGQKKIVLRNCGLINPEDLEEYVAIGGYQALHLALDKPNRLEIIEEVKRSKLRGRGGAGFPTGQKWSLLEKVQNPDKYVVCNADEGDPGAYMNRNEIESDPHMLLEGMMIGARATGAAQGVVYLRAEYPLAVKRFQLALDQARELGLLGTGVMGSNFNFDVVIVEGAGAFVCGEETAMITSLEGRAGRPRPRPPFPAQSGLWGKPTNINNVETWCNIPVIVFRGGAWFAGTGTPTSTGTKVFSLVGKITNTGLVEMPLGSPLKHIVYEIGQGSPNGKAIKAVQTGGPSGGCIPTAQFDATVDYESLAAIGAIMGSGGIVVMDEDNCMVDVARYFIEFTKAESCGKCVPCRAGLEQALRLLTRITDGQGKMADLTTLQELGQMVKEASLCGLGQTAPNPVLTTLRYFRHEYEQHIKQHRCQAGTCEKLHVAPCENSCPLHMRIPGFLELTKAGKFDQAAEMTWLDNPLPATTGRVCPHPCQDRCSRTAMDAPVNMRDVHRFLADKVFDEYTNDDLIERLQKHKQPASGKSIGVIGAGPAGLSAAYYLALLGHDVMVYEREAAAGGMLRYSIPDYRLPKDVLDKEIDILLALGVRFTFDCEVCGAAKLAELEAAHAAVIVATGTWGQRVPTIPGLDAMGVYHSLAFLKQITENASLALGGKVAVIGDTNAAIDTARSARRLGNEVCVLLAGPRSEMSAIPAEVLDAEEEGVKLLTYLNPTKVLSTGGQVTGLECAVTKAGDYTANGRRQLVPTGETLVIPCTAVILAQGELPQAVAYAATGLTLRPDGTVVTEVGTGATARAKIYAVGDLTTGPLTVTAAMGSGKDTARALDLKLSGKDRWRQMLGDFKYAMVTPAEPELGGRQACAHLPVAERSGNFSEVLLGLSEDVATRESNRCLRCDVKDHCVHTA